MLLSRDEYCNILFHPFYDGYEWTLQLIDYSRNLNGIINEYCTGNSLEAGFIGANISTSPI